MFRIYYGIFRIYGEIFRIYYGIFRTELRSSCSFVPVLLFVYLFPLGAFAQASLLFHSERKRGGMLLAGVDEAALKSIRDAQCTFCPGTSVGALFYGSYLLPYNPGIKLVHIEWAVRPSAPD